MDISGLPPSTRGSQVSRDVAGADSSKSPGGFQQCFAAANAGAEDATAPAEAGQLAKLLPPAPDVLPAAHPIDVAAVYPGDVAAAYPGDLAAAHPGDVAAAHPGDIAAAPPTDAGPGSKAYKEEAPNVLATLEDKPESAGKTAGKAGSVSIKLTNHIKSTSKAALAPSALGGVADQQPASAVENPTNIPVPRFDALPVSLSKKAETEAGGGATASVGGTGAPGPLEQQAATAVASGQAVSPSVRMEVAPYPLVNRKTAAVDVDSEGPSSSTSSDTKTTSSDTKTSTVSLTGLQGTVQSGWHPQLSSVHVIVSGQGSGGQEVPLKDVGNVTSHLQTVISAAEEASTQHGVTGGTRTCQLEVGYHDESLGWLSVRTTVGDAGTLHASVAGSNHAATSALAGMLPGLDSYLRQQSISVTSLSLAKPEDLRSAPGIPESTTGAFNASAGNSGGHQQQSSPRDSSVPLREVGYERSAEDSGAQHTRLHLRRTMPRAGSTIDIHI